MDILQDNWQAFALTGDPMAYLEFAQYRSNEFKNMNERRYYENNQSTGLGS
jgi:hypothetical protein